MRFSLAAVASLVLLASASGALGDCPISPPISFTQFVSDSANQVTGSFTPNVKGVLTSVQFHVSKNCPSVTSSSTSPNICPVPWSQPPFDTTHAINLIAYTSNVGNIGGSYDSNTNTYSFSASDVPLNLQPGDIICYDFTYAAGNLQCDSGICAPSPPTTQPPTTQPPTTAPFNVTTPTPTPTTPSGVKGDPQFTGFQGQSFQVHGVAGNIYNVFSNSKLQVNAQFVFLDQGHCDPSMNTLCYGHPGSYIGALGIQWKNGNTTSRLSVQSGRWNAGVHAHLNGKELLVSHDKLSVNGAHIRFNSKSRMVIHTSQLSLTIANSDRFLNLDMDLADKFLKADNVNSCEWPLAAPYTEPHGLMGQTWCMRLMDSDKIEGEIDDYVVADGLFGNMFQYNKF